MEFYGLVEFGGRYLLEKGNRILGGIIRLGVYFSS
jgi:hypothetical protein